MPWHTSCRVIKDLVTSKPMMSQAWTCLQLQIFTGVDLGSERVKPKRLQLTCLENTQMTSSGIQSRLTVSRERASYTTYKYQQWSTTLAYLHITGTKQDQRDRQHFRALNVTAIWVVARAISHWMHWKLFPSSNVCPDLCIFINFRVSWHLNLLTQWLF